MFFGKRIEPVSMIAVFLGNPGARYENTRHNAGFITAGFVESNLGVRINRLKFSSLTATVIIRESKAFLMKPQTYMNLSGDAVRQAMGFYKIPTSGVIVVSDDVSLPAGKLRIRRSGSAGGHNGLKDIIAKCGGDGFPRIRIGVGAPCRDDIDMVDWVLSEISGSDKKLIVEAAGRAALALEAVFSRGVDYAMSLFNSAPGGGGVE